MTKQIPSMVNSVLWNLRIILHCKTASWVSPATQNRRFALKPGESATNPQFDQVSATQLAFLIEKWVQFSCCRLTKQPKRWEYPPPMQERAGGRNGVSRLTAPSEFSNTENLQLAFGGCGRQLALRRRRGLSAEPGFPEFGFPEFGFTRAPVDNAPA
jgi:hypothetical protein